MVSLGYLRHFNFNFIPNFSEIVDVILYVRVHTECSHHVGIIANLLLLLIGQNTNGLIENIIACEK